MLHFSILVTWRMAVAHSSPVGEKLPMKARAPDIMAAYEMLFAPAIFFTVCNHHWNWKEVGVASAFNFLMMDAQCCSPLNEVLG